MKLVMSSLLLASLCNPWSGSSGSAHMIQSPDVSIQEGGTVNISCCWTEHFGRVTFSIQMNHINMTNKDKLEALFTQRILKNSSNCFLYIIDNVTVKNSGIYICKLTLEIPTLTDILGNGTVVNVIPKEENKTNTEGRPLVTIVLAVVGSVLLIGLAVLCLVLRRRQEQVTRVIYEVPHIDSDADKDSTNSSRGSSEWRQVPLYDYFERVQAPDNKSEAVLEPSSISLQDVNV